MAKPHPTISTFVKLLTERNYNYYCPVPSEAPLVSIISSFYNANKYFEENYKSIINQTWQNFEWIIVDDCSTDTEAIKLFKSLSERCPKIKTFYHQSNQGVSAGRNTAISYASGKYLFFTDLDDILDPTYIEKCVLFLETHPEFSFVNSYSIGFQTQEYWWEFGFNEPAKFIEQNWVTGRLLYRKSDFELLGGFDEELRFYEDWERWLRAITNHQKGWTIPEYLDCYRRTSTGLLATSVKDTKEEKRARELVLNRYQKFFAENKLENIYLNNKISAFEIDFTRKNLEIENKLVNQDLGKNILFFFPHLEVGGADKFNLDLLKMLSQRDYNITIATTLAAGHLWHHHFYNITPDIFHLSHLLPDSYWLDFARYMIESRQIDLVFVSNSYIAYYFLPILRAEYPKVAFVDYTHVYDPGWKGCGYPRISCQFSAYLDAQIVASEHLAQFYQQLNPCTKEKLKTCYINVNVDEWVNDNQIREEVRAKLGIEKEQIVLLYPARVVAQKRPLLLVDIVQELTKLSLPVNVIVLGRGNLLPEMEAAIAQHGLESVFKLLPPVEPEQMKEYYLAADILLLPSEYEGISLAIYEAMSMQLPIVASDVGGQKELVTPETGFLVAKGQGDAEEIEQYLQVLIPLIKDSSLRAQVGQLARQRVVEIFSLEKMGDCMENIFNEAISKRQTTANPEYNLVSAFETLILAIESHHLEIDWNWMHGNVVSLSQHNQQLQAYIAELQSHNQQLQNQNQQLQSHNQQLQSHNQQLQNQNQSLEEEMQDHQIMISAMESSKFWKIRKLWFKVKRSLKLTVEES